ncbi:MAG: hypothetical protein RLY82_545 [Pseudomonadota bacterium]
MLKVLGCWKNAKFSKKIQNFYEFNAEYDNITVLL